MRWAASELARLRGGGGEVGITRHTAAEEQLLAHRAALSIQSVAPANPNPSPDPDPDPGPGPDPDPDPDPEH